MDDKKCELIASVDKNILDSLPKNSDIQHVK